MTETDAFSGVPEELREPLRATVTREIERLVSVLQTKDDLVPAMLRFHLVTESLLERLIIAALPGGSTFLERGSISYHQKLELVNAFRRVDTGTIGSLRHLNKVRNASAHAQGTTVTEREIESIGRPMGREFIEIRRKHGATLETFALMTFAQVFGNLLSAVFVAEHADLLKGAARRVAFEQLGVS